MNSSAFAARLAAVGATVEAELDALGLGSKGETLREADRFIAARRS